MVDTDAPHEVIAAADAGAVTTITAQVAATIRALVPAHRPESAFDHATVDALRLATSPFSPAITAADRVAEAAYQHVVRTTNALAAADDAGGADVRRSGI